MLDIIVTVISVAVAQKGQAPAVIGLREVGIGPVSAPALISMDPATLKEKVRSRLTVSAASSRCVQAVRSVSYHQAGSHLVCARAVNAAA